MKKNNDDKIVENYADLKKAFKMLLEPKRKPRKPPTAPPRRG